MRNIEWRERNMESEYGKARCFGSAKLESETFRAGVK